MATKRKVPKFETHIWEVRVRHRDRLATQRAEINKEHNPLRMTESTLWITVRQSPSTCPSIDKAIIAARVLFHRQSGKFYIPTIKSVTYSGTIDK